MNIKEILQGIKSWVVTKLNQKQEVLVSGTNIKNINGTSILGSGNITFPTSDDIATTTEIDSLFTIEEIIVNLYNYGGGSSMGTTDWDGGGSDMTPYIGGDYVFTLIDADGGGYIANRATPDPSQSSDTEVAIKIDDGNYIYLNIMSEWSVQK